MKKHLLFICSSNVDRSPAAEALFKNSEKYEAKSAGVGPFAEKRVDQEFVEWADIIFVMDEDNERHKSLLLEQVPDALDKEIIILKVPNYGRNDERLERVLSERLSAYLK
jgi:predicted protein tyrosine phosphatase